MWGAICSTVDDRFRERCIRAGRIASSSTRKDGHFPVLLMWVPFVYSICLLAGVLGFNFKTSEVDRLSRAEVMQIVAIGAAFAVPFCVLIPPVVLGLLQVGYRTLKEIASGYPEKDDPPLLPYLYRQAEALLWLLTPRKSLPSDLTSSTSANV